MAKLADDVLRRWEEAVDHYWDETSGNCHECLGEFATGDVVLMFGDLDAAAASKHYLCARCGYAAIVSNNVPSATAIFISDAHRRKKLTHLDEPTVLRIREGFGIVDTIHGKMAELVARAGGLAGKDPIDEEPS